MRRKREFKGKHPNARRARVGYHLRRRTLLRRALDSAGMLVDAELVEGAQLKGRAERLLASPSTAYLHVHYAKPGCYAARIDRIVERAPG